MRSRIASLVAGSLTATALLVAPVSAAGGAPLTITLTVDLVGTDGETFTATGAFCPEGEAESFDFRRTGGASRNDQFHVKKTFTCENGDTLTIALDAASVGPMGGTLGGWRIIDGTGAYEGARGGGQIAGVGGDGEIVDTYTGIIRS